MSVALRGGHALVPQVFLHGANVRELDEFRRARVAKHMRRHLYRKLRALSVPAHELFDGTHRQTSTLLRQEQCALTIDRTELSAGNQIPLHSLGHHVVDDHSQPTVALGDDITDEMVL